MVTLLMAPPACHHDPLEAGAGDAAMGGPDAADIARAEAATRPDADDLRRDAASDLGPLSLCMAYPVTSSCALVQPIYYSLGSDTFGAVPELAVCGAFIPYDGCRGLQFTFDVDGCLSSATYGADRSDIPELRGCLAQAFLNERWPCLAGATVLFYESCFIP